MSFWSDPVNFISGWLREVLVGWGLAEGFATFLLTAVGVLVVATIALVFGIVLVWIERKVVARFQDRLGPNRVGPYGLLQPFADIIKLIIKEDITPEGADRVVYNIAPVLATAAVLLIWAVIPFAPTIFGADVNVGVLYIVAVGGLGTLAIIMAGWSSNNKYALLGAFRTVAQLVSYEVPLVLVLLVPVILARSMGMNDIVLAQDIWYVVFSPLAVVIFFIASLAEIGRTPFDLLEAESEIVAGFHVEYSGMKFGLFYAAELIHALTIAAITATLFLGGWRGPGAEQIPLLGVFYLLIKTFLMYFVVMWVRYTFPRIRIDQMMGFCWKFLVPLSLALLIVTAILDKAVTDFTPLARSLSHLGANAVLVLITGQLLRSYARQEREKVVTELPPAARPPEPSSAA
jgi:NADH-quinone oxidoreductase subunit H